MAHILYISYDGMTDPLGQSQVLPYLKGLCQKGHHFTLISFEKTERFQKHKADIEALIKGFSIEWIPLSYTAKPPIFSTVYDVFRLINVSKKLAKIQPIEIVHCRSYIAAFAGLVLKRKFGTKFIFDMRGFWADERIDGGIWRLSNPLFRGVYRYFKRKEKDYFTLSDATISLTDAGKVEITSWKLNGQSPITVIPCCADFDHFDYQKKDEAVSEEARQKLGIPEKTFVVSYLGSIGTWYLADEMFALFAAILKQRPNALFLCLTPDKPETIFQLAAKYQISTESVRVRYATRNEVPTLLGLSQLSIFFIKPAYSKKASSPTKLAELMGMGIPVITNTGVGDVNKIVLETGCGIVLSDFQESSLETAASQINTLLQIPKDHIRTEGISRFSLTEGVNRYDGVYQKVMGLE